MKAKDAPMTRALCQLVSQAVAAAEEEVIGEVEVTGKEAIEETEIAAEGKTPRKGKKVISEETSAKESQEVPTAEQLEAEAPTAEIPVGEASAEEIGQPHTAIDLKCMDKLKEAHRWCEETEIFGT